MLRLLTLATLTLTALAGFSGAANAASYGNFVDPTGTVSYLNVQDVNGLFGAPSVSLDSLDFTPTTYQAQCTQCPTGVTTSDILTLDILATSGRQIDHLQITEGLDYSIQSFDPAGFASVSVIANVFIDIVGVNGQSVNGINANVPILLTPSNNASVFGLGAQASGVILGNTGLIDLQQILANAGGSGEITQVRVSFDNTLQAFHQGSGGQALIRKRDADFVSLTAVGSVINTPEPSTAILLMGGLALLARRRPSA
jgi:hypothetical protein